MDKAASSAADGFHGFPGKVDVVEGQIDSRQGQFGTFPEQQGFGQQAPAQQAASQFGTQQFAAVTQQSQFQMPSFSQQGQPASVFGQQVQPAQQVQAAQQAQAVQQAQPVQQMFARQADAVAPIQQAQPVQAAAQQAQPAFGQQVYGQAATQQPQVAQQFQQPFQAQPFPQMGQQQVQAQAQVQAQPAGQAGAQQHVEKTVEASQPQPAREESRPQAQQSRGGGLQSLSAQQLAEQPLIPQHQEAAPADHAQAQQVPVFQQNTPAQQAQAVQGAPQAEQAQAQAQQQAQQAQAPVFQAQPQQAQAQPAPQPQAQPAPAPAPAVVAAPPTDRPVSVGDWVLTIFLMAIPIANIVLLLVWAFGSSTPQSKKNWARATLIWALIGIVIMILFVALGVVNYSMLTSYSYMR